MKCRFCGKKSLFEMCEECLKKQLPERIQTIWRENQKLSGALGEAYYNSTLKEYNPKITSKDSKENFGFNTFCDGIRLGLDVIMPLLNDEGIKNVKQKINDLLETRKKDTRRTAKWQ